MNCPVSVPHRTVESPFSRDPTGEESASGALGWHVVTACLNPLRNPCGVEFSMLLMDQHHDHGVAQCFGAGSEINLGRMGKHRFKAEARSAEQKGVALLQGSPRGSSTSS